MNVSQSIEEKENAAVISILSYVHPAIYHYYYHCFIERHPKNNTPKSIAI